MYHWRPELIPFRRYPIDRSLRSVDSVDSPVLICRASGGLQLYLNALPIIVKNIFLMLQYGLIICIFASS